MDKVDQLRRLFLGAIGAAVVAPTALADKRERSLQQEPGILLRGTDGHLYFIPDSKSSSFRVDRDSEAKLNSILTPGKATERIPPNKLKNLPTGGAAVGSMGGKFYIDQRKNR